MTFEMTQTEASDLARFLERLRKRMSGDDWHKPGIENALGAARGRAPAPDLAIAAIRAASEPTNRTPAVIGMDGPHWREASKPPRPLQVEAHERCTVCSEHQSRCREKWAGDHEFTGPAKPPEPEVVAGHVAALRSTLAPTAGPTERKTLADMAEANPELHAKVERLRAENPGLDGPAMREPDAAVPIAHPDATEESSG